MRWFFVLIATMLGCYMMIRSACRFLKRCKAGANVNEAPALSESVLVDAVLFVLGVLLAFPAIMLFLN